MRRSMLPFGQRDSCRGIGLRRTLVLVIASLTAAGLQTASGRMGFEDLARSGEWQRVLEIAARRANQLPLNPAEAMVAARAAREVENRTAEMQFLHIATGVGDEQLRRLAEVQLARLTVAEEPGRALELAQPAFGRENPWPVRALAAEVSKAAVDVGIEADRRAALENSMRRLSRSLRRELELSLALADDQHGRHRLERLLAASTRDLVALQAAEALAGYEQRTAKEQWRIALTLYHHAMYDRAAPIFELLAETRDGSVPYDEAAFLRGRCAFRRGRWREAIAWYHKALSWERSLDTKAEIEVHIGRCYELEGDLEGAVNAAVRAVRLKTTDDRRLFLARLRLRRGEPELAEFGIQRIRSRTDRARGEVMLAVDALRRGDRADALDRLEKVKRSPWSVPAAVLAAELAAEDGDAQAALDLLERVKGPVDGFWVHQARLVMGGLPEAQIEAWRFGREQEIKNAKDGSIWSALGRWAALEPDPRELRLLGGMVEAAFASFGTVDNPSFSPGLAAQLWKAGLEQEAARWDPGGWPRGNAVESAWTASRMLEHGFPWLATRVADGAWRQAGSEVPTTVLPADLRRALYPLPEPFLVREAAAQGGVPWSLLAAVAREESRWDPRALSAVGARGLVQLMPSTAEAVAVSLGLPTPTAERLFEPKLNLRLGAAELGRLIEVFEGRWAPAVAAYNAGEVQARHWLDQCGPECTSALYLLNISFGSTRAYTAEVLTAAMGYQELYGDNGVPSRLTD